MAEPLTLPEVSQELYAGPPEEFVARRNERAKQARAAKDRELAVAITALRRPSRSAWMVNLLARAEPDQVAGLLDLGEALRQAQRELSGPDLRRLSTDRHRVVEALTRRAVALAAEQDATATEAVRREISQSLQAALADPQTADLVRTGTLVQAADYSGFGPFVPGPDLQPSAARPPEPDEGEVADRADRADRADQAARAEQARREAEREAKREAERNAEAARKAEREAARVRADEAGTAAEAATTERDELAAQVEQAAAALAGLEDQLRQAEHRLAAAERDRDAAQQRLESLR